MRDRLVELIAEGRELCEQIPCEGCTRNCKGLNDCIAKVQADHLLSNGVIVPPCKVGDIIYAITCDRKDYMPLKVTSRESLVRWMDEGQFGHALFTTREEAEQALKGGAG